MHKRWAKWLATLLIYTTALGTVAYPTYVMAQPSSTAANASKPAQSRQELVEGRTAYAKQFKNADGTYQMEVHGQPVHYQDANGQWQEIDNHLVPSQRTGFAWKNAANAFSTQFAASSGNQVGRMEFGTHWAEWSLQGLHAVQGQTQGGQVTYAQVLPGVDLRYRVLANGVKEELVVTDDDTPDHYAVQINSDLTLQPDGQTLKLVDANQQTIFVLPQPYAVDAAGATTPLAYTNVKGNQFVLQIDERWLRHPDRVFPIVIDPTLVIQPNGSTGLGTYISNVLTSANYGGDTVLRAGNNGSTVYRSLIKFALSGIPQGATVTSAQLALYNNGKGPGTQPASYELHGVTREWLAAEATWNNATARQLWTTQGGDYGSSLVGTAQSITPSTAGWVSWDVTAMIAQAATGQGNLGFLLKSTAEDTTALREIWFTSSNDTTTMCTNIDGTQSPCNPKLTVTYTPDATPPTVTLNTPGTLSGTQATLSAVATDTGSGVDRVEFLVDGGVVGTATAATNGSYQITFDSTHFSNGSHTVDVRAYDKAGNVGRTSQLVLLSDSFTNPVQVSTAESTVSFAQGVASLSMPAQFTTLGTPTASSTKPTEDHSVSQLGKTYWKSAGQTSPSGMETLLLDFGGYYNVTSINVTPLRQADGLLVRAELLDANGNLLGAGAWSQLKNGGSDPQLFPIPVSGQAQKARLYFTNLTPDPLTGLYHANVANVSMTYSYSYPTTVYQVDQYVKSGSVGAGCGGTQTPPNPNTCTATFQVSLQTTSYKGWTENCSSPCLGSVTYSPMYDYQWGFNVSYTFTPTTDQAYLSTSAQTGASTEAIGSWCTGTDPSIFPWSASLSWPAYVTGVTGEYWSPSASSLYYRDDSINHVTTVGNNGYIPCNSTTPSSYHFYWQQQWTTYSYWKTFTRQMTETHRTPVQQWNSGTSSFTPTATAAAWPDNNAVTNITGTLRPGVRWVSAALPQSSSSASVDLPFSAATKVNAVYIQPQWAGMTATLTLSSNGATVLNPITISNLQTGTYALPQTVTADKLHIDLTNLQLVGSSYYAGLAGVQPEYVNTLASGKKVVSTAQPVGGATQLTLNVSDGQPGNTKIQYQLRFDGSNYVSVTPGTPVAVPTGAQQVAIVATLTADGQQSPFIYKWSLTSTGNGQLATFQNGLSAAVQDTPLVSITTNPLGSYGMYTVGITTPSTNIQQVAYYVDGALRKTVTASPWSWTWYSNAETSGTHVIKALLTTTDGAVGGATTVLQSYGFYGSSPIGLTATTQANSQNVSLRWQGDSQATYTVYRALVSSFSTIDKSWSVSGTSFTDTDAKTLGQAYYYRVYATPTGPLMPDQALAPSSTRSIILGSPELGTNRWGLDRFYPYATVGMLGASGYVNLTNGNLVVQTTDLALPAPGLVATVRRTFNSLPSSTGSSPRWRWNNEITATTDPTTGNVTITNSDGATYLFTNSNGIYQRPAGVYMWLSNNNGTLMATLKSGITWTFRPDGQLASMADRNGNTLQYLYDNQGRLQQAVDTTGRAIDYAYNSAGQLSSVTYGPANDRRSVLYNYDGAGNLWTVADLAGKTWQYVYDLDHRLVGEITPQGSLWSVQYNTAGKVANWSDPRGDTTALSYDTVYLKTTLTDPLNHSAIFTYYGTGQLRQRDQTVTTTPTSTTTITTKFEYDANYNVIKYTDPLNQTTNITYDSLGRGDVVTVTEPPAASGQPAPVTNYAYRDSRNPDLPTEIDSPLNVAVWMDYDEHGNMLDWSQGVQGTQANVAKRYSYFADGQLASQRDEWGGITTYEYDAYGNLIRQYNAVGDQTKTQYDWFGNPVSSTDPAKNTSTYQFDKLGRSVKQIFPDGTQQNTLFTDDGLTLFTTDNNGNATTYTYDRAGRPTQVVDSTGTTQYQYDVAGNRVGMTNPNGWHTSYSFDEAYRQTGQSVSVTQPTAATYSTAMQYDNAGHMISATDPTSYQMTAQYDNLGREVLRTAPGTVGQAQLQTVYDLRGRRTATIDPLRHKVSYFYDELDRLTEVRENLLSGQQYDVESTDLTAFTALSSTLSQDTTSWATGSASLQVATSGSSSGQGVQVKVPVHITQGQTVWAQVQGHAVSGTGAVLVRLRDNSGTALVSSSAVTLGTGWSTLGPISFTAASDTDNLVLEVVTPGTGSAFTFDLDSLEVDQSTKTQYPAFSQGIASVTDTHSVTTTDALGHTSAVTYDLLGRVVQTTNGLNKSAQTQYLPQQNQRIVTDALAHKTVYQADVRGRLSSIQYFDGTSVAYTYDGNGNRLTMSDSLGVTSYSYDGANRPLRVVDPYNRTVNYTYQGATLYQVVSPVGTSTFTYNEVGLPFTVTAVDAQNSTNKDSTSFTYDGAGRLLTRATTIGTNTTPSFTTTYQYDPASKLLASITGQYTGTPSANLRTGSYKYDLAGNRTQYVQSFTLSDGTTDTNTFNYTYDPMQRLTVASDSTGTRTYNYDGVGNRLKKITTPSSGTATTEAYGYDAANHLTTLTTSGSQTSTATYTYDAVGNQVQISDSVKGMTSFSYDAANRLITTGFPDASQAVNRYNGDGQRLYTKDSTRETYYLFDRGSVIADLDGAGATLASYIRDLSGKLISTRQRTGNFYYHADGLGSVVGLTTSAGAWDTRYKYDEFGIVSAVKGTSSNTFKFTSAQYDEMAGLYHLGARHYDPQRGRFLTQDTYSGNPWEPWTQNLYTYVSNNPVNLIDPTGHTAASDGPICQGDLNICVGISGQVDKEDPNSKVCQFTSAGTWGCAFSTIQGSNLYMTTLFKRMLTDNLEMTKSWYEDAMKICQSVATDDYGGCVNNTFNGKMIGASLPNSLWDYKSNRKDNSWDSVSFSWEGVGVVTAKDLGNIMWGYVTSYWYYRPAADSLAATLKVGQLTFAGHPFYYWGKGSGLQDPQTEWGIRQGWALYNKAFGGGGR